MELTTTYELEQFEPLYAPEETDAKGAIKASNDQPGADWLPVENVDIDAPPINDRHREIIRTRKDPNKSAPYRSRSEAGASLVALLLKAKTKADVCRNLLLDERYLIGDYIREKSKPVEAAEKEVRRQIEFVGRHYETAKDGQLRRNSQKNVRIALAEAEIFVTHDDFQDRIVIDGLEGHGPFLNGKAQTVARLKLEREYGVQSSSEHFLDVLTDVALENRFHPVRDYLNGLQWDGVPRIGKLLPNYAGAEATALVCAVGQLWMIAAVRRIRHPGTKFDTMLVLEGGQGTGKSTFFTILAVKPDWFGDQVPISEDPKRLIEAIRGKWILEWAELAGIGKKETETVKAVLSRTKDEVRMVYEKLLESFPRECVFGASTNSDNYLRDTTGNRRFWPVKTSIFDLEALSRDRDQLWAEAAHLEAQGASISLDRSLYEEAAREQGQRVMDDPFFDALNGFLDNLEGHVTAFDVWRILGKLGGHRSQADNKRMGDAMKELGFEKKKWRVDGIPQNVYWRGNINLRIYVHCDPRSPVPHEVSNNEISAKEEMEIARREGRDEF